MHIFSKWKGSKRDPNFNIMHIYGRYIQCTISIFHQIVMFFFFDLIVFKHSVHMYIISSISFSFRDRVPKEFKKGKFSNLSSNFNAFVVGFFCKIVNGLLMPNIHWVKQIIVSTLAFNIQFCSTFLCGHTVVAVVTSWCALHSPLLAYSYIHVCCINLKNWWTFLLLISIFLEHYENENSK